MDSVPGPLAGYGEALARFDELIEAESSLVNDASGSLLFAHGAPTERVYLLVHGTTNSPRQWEELGAQLHDRGHNVLILRMPYHGLQSHDVRELAKLQPQDLRRYADEAVDIASALGDELVVGGISGGAAVAAWMAQNRAEVDRAVLLAPFFGIFSVPPAINPLLANAFTRLPKIVLDNPLEPKRDWVYRGQTTRGVAAFLALGQEVLRGAQAGRFPAGELIVLTTAVDDNANNDSTSALLDLWRSSGTQITEFNFEESLDIPHNSVDPSADPQKKHVVYDKMLELLGENIHQ
jgi:esterase/lipase